MGLDHVVLRARSAPHMVAFYCHLGCAVEKVQEELGLTQLRAGTALIDIVDIHGELGRMGGHAPGPDSHNMDHLCLRVEPFDSDRIRTFLTDMGYAPGEVVQRYGAEGYGPSIYVNDPEGNMVELKGPASGTQA